MTSTLNVDYFVSRERQRRTMIAYTTAEELGKIVHDERKLKGYTQTKLARYSGVGINFISNLENGKETSELGKVLRVIATLGLDLFVQQRGE